MPARRVELIEDTVTKYGKSDLERLGLFIEMPYMVGKRYNFPKLDNIKGLNMIPGGPKIKCGTMDGYFDKQFMRLFEGERPPKKDLKKERGSTPFMPVGPSKKHATPGDYFGTFFPKPCEYFSRAVQKQPTKERKRQVETTFITSPAKKGGPGYADICLSKYPEHQSDRQKIKKTTIKPLGPPLLTVHYPKPYFENNPYRHPDGKIQSTYRRPDDKTRDHGVFMPYGFNKEDGYFEHFPEGKPDKYVPIYEVFKQKKATGIYIPPHLQPKTIRHFPTIDLKTKTGVNAKTFKTYEPNFVKYLL